MTSLNIVAHPDDDLLFLNPDILDEKATIIYMTMGDDGRGNDYAKMRQRASRNAWSGYRNVKLEFFPLYSNSFRSGDKYGWLHSSWEEGSNNNFEMGHSSWNPGHLLEILKGFIENTKCDVIRTHDPDTEPSIDHDEPHLDHIDHIYTAKFVQEAAKVFPLIPVYAYMGYPIRYQPENVAPELAAKKLQMWRKYQEIDTEVAGEQWDIAMTRCYKRRIQ